MPKDISDVVDIPSVMEHSVKIDKEKFLEYMLHNCKYNQKIQPNKAAIPSGTEYIYSPSPVGTVLSVQCKCGRKDNITDYSDR